MLGKVYNEYNIGTSYKGSYAETDTSLLILSNNLLEIDKQSGIILREIKLSENYTNLSYNSKNETIILNNNNNKLEINYQKETTKIYPINDIHNENECLLPLYNIKNYKITKGTKFNNNQETKESKQTILLLNYKKIDNKYNEHNISIQKESDRLVIKGDFTKKDKAYIILDKFLDKKVYDLNNGYNYINDTGLSGDYSIYIKINNNIYKTNNYVTF